ncbi:secreted RxLR effector protein 161-like [Carya illinoinensis]|uniref:secreted RxLR effector protein 161-like n=1 Tax=Carya illinoinensis TaxID=32201 RepID=UPI001C71C415|nr:secreted RxLR effector protein 161-like [Carya illinoinensis]
MDSKTKPVSTLMASYFKFSVLQSPKDDEEHDYIRNVQYASIVGSLMYAMVCIRPDISQAVSLVSCWTIDLGLKFEKSENSLVTGYIDSNYASDLKH